MIIKCRECDEPMLETQKGRPAKLPPQVKWVVCKQCEKGVEVIGDDAEDIGIVTAMNYEETVTITHYITIKKIKDKVKKFTYIDKERKKLVNEEDVV